MNNRNFRTLGAVLCASAILFNPSMLFAESPQKGNQAWSQRMQALSKNLSELLPDLSSHERFTDKKNRARIEKNVKALGELAHSIGKKGDTRPVDADPTLRFVAELFEQEMGRAQRELKRGNHGYARSVLRSVTGYCITCHTRSTSGPKFPELKLTADIESLKPFEKAEYFVATRQFDRAFQQYESLLRETRFAKAQKLDWEQSAKTALSIAVRVQRDTDRARQVVDLISSQKEAPYFVRSNALAWRESIDQWSKEGKKTIESAEGLFAEAARLTAAAKHMQKYPADHAGDVLYLRSSAVIHDLLAKDLPADRAAQALYLAGLSYEALDDPTSIHELFYESCIRTAPGSDVAKQCYGKLEEVLYFGYSGSGGVSIPDDVLERLAKLRTLAGVADTSTED